MAPARPQQLEAAARQAFGMHARTDAHLVEQVDGGLLQHAGADAAEHVVAGLALEDHRVDAGLVQQLSEQQAGRAGANDDDVGKSRADRMSGTGRA